MTNDPMRYALELELLEHDGVRDDEHAIDLLRSEFALAHNAARFDRITAEDLELGAVWRSTPQEGVTRYEIELFVTERHADLDDDVAAARLCQVLTDALNASYFLRICDDALTMRLVSRAPAVAPLRAAA